jgi:glycosyltransferase involved in cell wall biosynthesis
MPTKLRIAYTNVQDIRDIRTWSGTPYHLTHALEQHGVSVEIISPLETVTGLQERAKRARYDALGQKFHLESQTPALEDYARQITAAIRASRADLVLATNPVPVAMLETTRPVVVWTDATYALLHDAYPQYVGICAESVTAGCRVERMAAERATMIYSSRWAADSAINDFGADPDRVQVMLYGANLEDVPTTQEAMGFIAPRSARECKLLWIGAQWDRKGGDVAVGTLNALTARGVRATLTMIGCDVPPEVRQNPHVTAPGFINKHDLGGRAMIDRLLAESHFLIVPSRADCTPMVVGEANAFALPALLPDIGGISSVLRDAQNGFLLPHDANGEAYADRIEACLSADGVYANLCHTARGEFETHLSWDASMRRLKPVLLELVERADRTAMLA